MENQDLKKHPLRSVHTDTLTDILNQMKISLVVTTYQAGKVIVVRSEGEVTNTHFKIYDKPMGLTLTPAGFSMGSGHSIVDFRNIPSAGKSIEDKKEIDACYIPSGVKVTGDIDIHEMGYGEEGLYFINTKFSCLCKKDEVNSFTPIWKPPFITGYDMTDRCHLNGLAMFNGKPKYVTTLGESDKAMGWRENKAFGGTLIDIESNEILYRGLSMPHSPRIYRDKLWLLESGKGSLSYFDLEKKEIVNVATLPGFTRGIDFYGNLAFIGLSKVRESAVFSGIPLTKQISERICGVWVVDINSGNILGFLRFEEGVEEIFAVSVLPATYPDILEFRDPLVASSYVLDDEAMKLVSNENREAEYAMPYFEEGNSLYNKGKKEEAIELYKKALSIQKDYLPAKYNIGITLSDLEKFNEAEAVLKEVVAEDAAHVEAINSLGFIYHKQKRFLEAKEQYEKAIKIKPSYSQAHFNLGMNLLLLGKWRRGLEEYEYRYSTKDFQIFSKHHKLYRGEDIQDKTLLVHTEQGAGDAIMMSRFLKLVRPKCKKLIVVCTPNLQPLFEQIEEIDEIKNAGVFPKDSFDYFLPIMSLPLVLDLKKKDIDANSYLQGDRSLVPLEDVAEKRVGIVWRGSKTYANDKNRSKGIDEVLKYVDVGSQIYSLQKGEGLEELEGKDIINLDSKINTFADTASIISQLDEVITVDTSVAHLSGAMGVKTKVIISKVPDWRWGIEGDKSYWYESVQLIRE